MKKDRKLKAERATGEPKSEGWEPNKASSGHFIAVAAGNVDSCGLTSTGSVECWGQFFAERTEASSKATRTFCNANAAAGQMKSSMLHQAKQMVNSRDTLLWEGIINTAKCVEGAIMAHTPANLRWFKDPANQTKAKRIYDEFADDLVKISRTIAGRNAADLDMDFNAFDPKHLELSISL